VALLWLEGPAADLAHIHSGVDRVNARLSHAEQIKRWAILPDRLTVMNGSLTGSMKLKREVLTSRFSAVIEALYQGATPPQNVIFGSINRAAES
jgi:long-chain acyl-CoA synthetase